ncbi:hypothetical protein [Paraburkholderia tropica]|uniref:hypothetical protein n=1 Tax=Paraburkholderia tropica TaxID=92647 RepID=UPI001F3E1B3F|nr:hypothetical protein [Paraburkholderia tropica]
MSERLFFMIEGGKALELVKRHIADRMSAIERAKAIAVELGAEDVSTSKADGKVVAVRFKGAPHPDFKKPDKWGARPRKGTDWAKRFADQKGYEAESYLIQEGLGVPCQISYSNNGGSGFRMLGVPFTECGFLFLGKSGPYAMWIPDVEAEVRADVTRGFTVEEPALSFKPEFEGCRRIKIEEWEYLVAKHNLEKARAA